MTGVKRGGLRMCALPARERPRAILECTTDATKGKGANWDEYHTERGERKEGLGCCLAWERKGE